MNSNKLNTLNIWCDDPFAFFLGNIILLSIWEFDCHTCFYNNNAEFLKINIQH